MISVIISYLNLWIVVRLYPAAIERLIRILSGSSSKPHTSNQITNIGHYVAEKQRDPHPGKKIHQSNKPSNRQGVWFAPNYVRGSLDVCDRFLNFNDRPPSMNTSRWSHTVIIIIADTHLMAFDIGPVWWCLGSNQMEGELNKHMVFGIGFRYVEDPLGGRRRIQSVDFGAYLTTRIGGT